MADFQEQLRQYRLQKRRKETVDNFKDKLRRFWMLGTGANKDTTIEVQQVRKSNIFLVFNIFKPIYAHRYQLKLKLHRKTH